MDGVTTVVVALIVVAGGIGLIAFRPAAHRGLIGLATLAGLIIGSLGAFTIVFLIDQSPGCDLPCGRWSPTITYAGGVVGAVLFGLAAWLGTRYFTKPS